MKHYEVFEKCKDLALGYGYTREDSYSLTVDYADSYGLDFRIMYQEIWAWTVAVADSSREDPIESIKVYLGNRLLYSYAKECDKEFYCDDINWCDLVTELLHIEFGVALEENVHANNSMLCFYREESEKSRKIFSDFTDTCLALIKNKGTLDDNHSDIHGAHYYRFSDQVNGNEFKVYFKDSLVDKNVEIHYDGKIVFFYSWDRLYDTDFTCSGGYDFSNRAWVKELFEFCNA